MKGVKNKVLLGRALGFIPLKTAISFYEKTATMCNDDNSKWVSIPSGWEHFFGGLNKRSMLFPTAKATFEGREVSVPGKYEEYLIGLYGPSYMSLPPEDRREKHVVAAFDLGGNADSEQNA